MGSAISRLSNGPARYLAGPILVFSLWVGSVNAQSACDDTRESESIAPGQLCVEMHDGVVSIQSQDVELQRLLDEIARRSALLVFSEQPLDSLVSMQFETLELHKALQRILRNRNYLLVQVQASATPARERSRSILWIHSDGNMGDNEHLHSAERVSSVDAVDIQVLRGQLTSDHLRTRKNAIKSLQRLEADKAIPMLTYALTDENKEIRFRAIQALAGFRTDDVAMALAIATGDEHPGVRAEAAHWLGTLGGDDALQVLENTLYDPDSDVRETTIKAFARIGGEKVVSLLEKALEDSDEDVRHSAAESLLELSGR